MLTYESNLRKVQKGKRKRKKGEVEKIEVESRVEKPFK